MTAQVAALAVLLPIVVAVVAVLLRRDARRAQERAEVRRWLLLLASAGRMGHPDPWQRDRLDFMAQERVAMSVMRPADFVKVGPL